MRIRTPLLIAACGVASAAAGTRLFPRAFPAIALDNRLTQATALARADSFFTAHGLAVGAGRRAVRFGADDSLLTYVDLAAGGTDSVNALVRASDVAIFAWAVRAFEPGEVHEALVTLATDGRVVGFRRRLADADTAPTIGEDSATVLATAVVTAWIGEPPGRWRVVATSYQTRKESGRVDRTVTFERTDRRVGEAPLRLDVVMAGNQPVEVRPYIDIPEAFSRRYAEMRSANDLLATVAMLGIVALGLVGAFALRRYARAHTLRWRAPIVIGALVGVLLIAAGINAAGAGWFLYDTALPEGIYEAMIIVGAVAGGVAMGAVVTLTLAAAEVAARHAFPAKIDWWQLWRARGTREVAVQVGGGYALAAFGFAYVALFYLFTRHALGWWVPSELLDNPNQIATPMPWISGIALSLQAAVWEESLFRALPLSVLAIWAARRPHRDWWMRAGVVATALVFGFAHSNYPSWPPYSRGFELFVEAALWAVLYLRVGLLVTVLAHFVYDLVLFSLFTSTGSALAYRISAGVAIAALLAPALVVGWRILRQRGFVAMPEGAHFDAWRPTTRPAESGATVSAPTIGTLSVRSRRLALVAVTAALGVVLFMPAERTRGPAFTAGRARVVAVADSMLAARADASAHTVLAALANPASGWRRLTADASDTLSSWPTFLAEQHLDSLAEAFAGSYVVPAWWTVRYVRTTGTVAERAEEWRVRVLPDGRPLDARHIVADSAPGASPTPELVRRLARAAMAGAGYDTARFVESEFQVTPRPHRQDATVMYTDTTVHLPEGAAARAWVSFAGEEVLVVRRGIELPESFRREQRARQTRVFAVGGLWFALMVAVVGTGAVFVARRRPPRTADQTFSRRTALVLLGVVAAALVAGILNNWRSVVFSYDTATPWVNHVATVLIGVVVAPVGALLLAGAWQVMEMIRRRTGIPAWPSGGVRAVQDGGLAGAGLGAVAALAGTVPVALQRVTMGTVPTTPLNHGVPMLDGALALPFSIAANIAFSAIPLLLVLAVAQRARTRWLVVALAVAVTAGVFAPVATTLHREPVTAVQATLSLACVGLLVVALVHYGRRGVYTWLLAALSAAALGALGDAAHASTNGGRAGAVVTLVAVGVACAWLMREARRRASPTSGARAPSQVP